MKTKTLIQISMLVVFLSLLVMAAIPVKAAPATLYCVMQAGKPFWMVHVRNESYMPPAGTFGIRSDGTTPTNTIYVFTRPFTNSAGFTVWVKNSDIYCID